MTQDSYDRHRPFYASIKERYNLSKEGSLKKAQHITIDIQGSGLTYEVGDSVGIFSSHSEELVKKTLCALRFTGEEQVIDPSTQKQTRLKDLLTASYSITDITVKFLQEIHERQSNLTKKEALAFLFQECNRDLLKTFLKAHEIWDLLLYHHEVFFTAQELITFLKPLLPRFYSISSSQKYVGEEIHLTITPLEYETNGHQRRGVCTHFICEMAQLKSPIVPIFIQPTHTFRLPQDHRQDIIMIGPGTGVAPFRAFLQERLFFAKATGRHWLFFVEKQKNFDYYYESEWPHYSNYGDLRLELAFSRDQEHKVYVQHRMLEKGKELFEWITGGAYLYVCGDATYMAKDVEAALLQILQDHGEMDLITGRNYLKNMRKEKRYLRDIY